MTKRKFLLLLASKQAKPLLLQAQLQKLKMLSKVLSKALSHLAGDDGNLLCMEDIVTF